MRRFEVTVVLSVDASDEEDAKEAVRGPLEDIEQCGFIASFTVVS